MTDPHATPRAAKGGMRYPDPGTGPHDFPDDTQATPDRAATTTRSVIGDVSYIDACRMWGDDPQKWPAWNCIDCGQHHSGYSLDCGRCGSKRHGGTSDA